ncbi:hypothetical protein NQ318_017283 [Aromia moschata]|uniref:Uncharacterized protein n=1 Tax=Aromia moschata TaxID=1265417 RepID=A0AAV8XXN6_9CUCU|nr:hypothetical protein NQ318_017283 [Aromia moschata]
MQWSQNLCRTCGQISETCHFIYNKDAPNTLECKLKKCLNLDLCKGDYKPKQICHSCVIKLNELSDFIDICYATNEKLESIYYTSQNWQNRNYECLPSQKQSVIVSSRQAPNSLDFELYKNTGIVLENINVTNCPLNDSDMHLDLVGNGEYTTENCENFSATDRPRSQYMSLLRHPNGVEDSAPKYDNCQTTENNKTNNKICYIKYDNPYSQNGNTNSEFGSQADMDLDTAKKKMVTVYAVQKSIVVPPKICKKEKTKKSYACPKCDKGTLNSHMAIHTNKRPYKCENCPKSFAIKSDLTMHKKIHNSKHKCSFCCKTFSVPSKLQRHIRIHMNNKPFACNFPNCGKAFSDKRNLDGHKFSHLTEKNYSCGVCNKMFKSATRLKRHSKCHNTTVLYSCELCSKKYKYKSNLVSHIKKHNNICPFCKKNCESNTVLTEHLKSCKIRN